MVSGLRFLGRKNQAKDLVSSFALIFFIVPLKILKLKLAAPGFHCEVLE